MGVMNIGFGAGAAVGIDNGKYGKNTRGQLENMINQLRRQREEYSNHAPATLEEKANGEDKANKKVLAGLDERLKNLETRLDKLKEREQADDGKCETCENRKYQDVSDDPGVSFKTASKVGPQGAAVAVRSHEYEHVNRNQAKAAREGREVVSQTVRIKTAICPECGTPYVAGGETVTTTKAKPPKEVTEALRGNDDKKVKFDNKPEKQFDNGDKKIKFGPSDEDLRARFRVGLADAELKNGNFLNIVA